ncbi:hypothetical protein Mapa_002848 [Marchantia paleacea]|nr:hypothetical protein Mapa_002848 [Marchantia paleacea]
MRVLLIAIQGERPLPNWNLLRLFCWEHVYQLRDLFTAQFMDSKSHFESAVVYEIFKKVWARSSEDLIPKEETEDTENVEDDSVVVLGANAAAVPSKKPRSTTANANALKLTCELLKLFLSETVQRAAMVAEAEGSTEIDGSHLERILPQLLLDF